MNKEKVIDGHSIVPFSINNISAMKKYLNNGKILIEIYNTNSGKVYNSTYFKNNEHYKNWIDTVTNDQDWYYNEAQVLTDIIDSVRMHYLL